MRGSVALTSTLVLQTLTSFLLRRLVIPEDTDDTCARISSLPPFKGDGEPKAVSRPRVHDSDFLSESTQNLKARNAHQGVVGLLRSTLNFSHLW